MKNLTLEDIKEILRIEVRKSILYSHQVNEETNKHSEDEAADSDKANVQVES